MASQHFTPSPPSPLPVGEGRRGEGKDHMMSRIDGRACPFDIPDSTMSKPRGFRPTRLMKRLLTFALVIGVCVAIATPSLAIEKHKKDAPPPKSDTTALAKPQPQPQSQPQAGKVSDTLKTPKQRMTPPVFNDFIDVNMNGIDDRLEQGGYFIPSQKTPKTPAIIKKTDSTKTSIPKSTAKKPQKKDK